MVTDLAPVTGAFGWMMGGLPAGGERKNLQLSKLEFRKLPLRYGTESCHMALTDGVHTREILELRNTEELGRFVHSEKLTEESHCTWLAGQLERPDALNFVLMAQGRFAGTLSLYQIRHGESCEFGRMMIPNDERRLFALGAELLGMSFAFEVLGVQTLYCSVVEGNSSVLNFHLRNGWSRDARYERFEEVNGANVHLIGLSIDRLQWPQSFEKMQPLAKRLFATY